MATYEFRADGHNLIDHIELDGSVCYIPSYASPFRVEMLFEYRDHEDLMDTLLRMCNKTLADFNNYVCVMGKYLTHLCTYRKHYNDPFWDFIE